MKLSKDALANAKSYLFTYGRPLEQALFSYHFEGGQKAAILSEIAEFQNTDGGFGHAIEPDLRNPHSSAIATSTALKILRSIDADANHPVVTKAIGYLVETCDSDRLVWDIIPKSSQDFPHAFWWAYDGISERFGGFRINPTVALSGHLQYFSESAPTELLNKLLATSLERLGSLDVDQGFYDLLCYVDLATAKGLEPQTRSKIMAVMEPIITKAIVREPNEFGGHALSPLLLISSKDSPITDIVESDLIHKNLDHEIQSQLPDGSWPIPWSWQEKDPEAWGQAEKEWKGSFIVHKLLTLSSFGRVA